MNGVIEVIPLLSKLKNRNVSLYLLTNKQTKK